MKRMNLKKAISLMAFTLILFLGVQSASAQVVEGASAIGMVNAKIESLSSQQVGISSPTFSSEEAKQLRFDINFLKQVSGLLKDGTATSTAINTVYNQYADSATGSRLVIVDAAKAHALEAVTMGESLVH